MLRGRWRGLCSFSSSAPRRAAPSRCPLEAVDAPSDGPGTIRNAGSSRALGLEVVLEGRASAHLTGRASHGLVPAEDASTGARLTYSPQHLAKVDVLDDTYVDPVSADFARDPIRQDGRTAGLELDHRFEWP